MKASLLSEKHVAYGHEASETSFDLDPEDGTAVVNELVEDKSTHDVAALRNKALVACLKGHTARVVSGGFALRANVACTASRDGTLRVWDLATARCLHMMHHDQQWYVKVSISTDARFVVTCNPDYVAHVWCGLTGTLLHTTDPGEAYWSQQFSKDGRYFMSTMITNTVRVWSVEAWDAPRNITLPEGSHIFRVVFSDQNSDHVVIIRYMEDPTAPENVTVFCLRTGIAVDSFVANMPRNQLDGEYAYANNVLFHMREDTVTAVCLGTRKIIGSVVVKQEFRLSSINYDAKMERLTVWDFSGRVSQYQLEFAHRDEIFACLAAVDNLMLGGTVSKFLRRDGDGRIVRRVFEWLRLF